MSTAADVFRALGGKKKADGYLVYCPSHDDKTPSLSVSDGDNGKLLWHCHAGCTSESVGEAFKTQGLYSPRNPFDYQDLPEGIFGEFNNAPYRTHWTYEDEEGAVVGYVVQTSY